MNDATITMERRYARIRARLRRIQGQIVSLGRCLATEPELINLIQRAAAARGAMNGLVADLMEERLLSLQALATSDETRAELAEMIDITVSSIEQTLCRLTQAPLVRPIISAGSS